MTKYVLKYTNIQAKSIVSGVEANFIIIKKANCVIFITS